MLQQEGSEPGHVCFAVLAQQPAGGFLHEIFRRGELPLCELIRGIQKPATPRERHQRHHRRAADPK